MGRATGLHSLCPELREDLKQRIVLQDYKAAGKKVGREAGGQTERKHKDHLGGSYRGSGR